MIALDHLAVAGETLEATRAHVEDALGVAMGPGGEHALMGTWNRLLSLGPEIYLEAITVNPDAPDPGRARWFDLDRFRGAPRLANWIARTDDLAAAMRAAPPGMGEPVRLTRGVYDWTIAVPEDGILPFDGAAPALIEWHGEAHPAAALADVGCRLLRLEIAHPRAMELMRAFPALLQVPLLRLGPGPVCEMRAEIMTPHGLRYLR